MKDKYAIIGITVSLLSVLALWFANQSHIVNFSNTNPIIAPWLAKILGLIPSKEQTEMAWESGIGLTEGRAILYIISVSCIFGLLSVALSFLANLNKENHKLSIAALLLGNMVIMLVNIYIGLLLLVISGCGAIWQRSSLTRRSSAGKPQSGSP